MSAPVRHPRRVCRIARGVGLLLPLIGLTGPASAGGVQALNLPSMQVTGQSSGLVGNPPSASVGTVTYQQLENRPILRPGELLEVVPGLIVTQHSGDGKANQYFMRGFNLDHGTDLAGYVNGIPVNLPSHAHGQGYMDLNWMIPELVQSIKYKKGPYYAEEGNFASAGSIHINYFKTMPQGIYRLEKGMYDYNRALAADSTKVGPGTFLYGFEYAYKNGPWDLPEGYRKYNGFLRYSLGDELNGMSFSFQGYNSSWHATDQVPEAAIQQGLISRYGNIDPTDGGHTGRNSLEFQLWRNSAQVSKRLTVYWVRYWLDLYSDFTFYLPYADGGYPGGATLGNQIWQGDRRDYMGMHGSYTRLASLFGYNTENTVGVQIRYDDIPTSILAHTSKRQLVTDGVFIDDNVNETRYSLYAKSNTHWTPWFRTILGLRGDFFDFSVGSNAVNGMALGTGLAVPETAVANRGTVLQGVFEPKLSMIFGPWSKTEYYVNLGEGIHTNDARGAVTTMDPVSGQSVSPDTAVVKSKGLDLGMRTAIIPKVQMALSLWALNLASELQFDGDGGTTEASYPSRRMGFEFSTYYRPLPWLIADLDIADTRARYKDNPAGRYIPNAVEGVISGGVTVNRPTGVFGGLRVRYIGPRPLNEAGNVKSSDFTVLNAQVGYHITKALSATVQVLNLLDSKANNIAYYYTYALKGQAPQTGTVVHPIEPRQLRFMLTMRL